MSGIVAGTSNDTGFFPHIEVVIDRGLVVEVRDGGRYGELWREAMERCSGADYPGFPYAGWAFLNDCSIGTNPKGYRHIDGLCSYNDSWTNMPERARAGVLQFGFGAEHADERFMTYAKANRLPTMHVAHVHNNFGTYELRRRGTGEWVRIVDKGHLTVLDQPRIRRMADTMRSPAMLEYGWIPAIPGVNHPGDYTADFASDPAGWIARDQRGEFVSGRTAGSGGQTRG